MAKKKINSGALYNALQPPLQSGGIIKKLPKAAIPQTKKPSTPKTPSAGGPSATSVAPRLTGQYDPALDAQYRASQRGLEHLRQDTGTAGSRSGEDLMTTLSLAGRNQQRANEDFDTQLQSLFRQFGLQGQQQAQSANAAGVLHGGTLGAAAQVRQGNLAFARQPIDVGRARTAEDYTSSTGEAQRAYGRAAQDRNTKLQRAIAEAGYYGSDLSSEAIYQAAQNNPDLLAQLQGGGATPKSGKSKTKPSKSGGPGLLGSGLVGTKKKGKK
jgi:hypothetical protein